MLPVIILKNVFTIFSAFFLVTDVNSQVTYEDFQQPNIFRSCDKSSYCKPIQRCSKFREGWNRPGVGITCGYGVGPYRMICCPRGYGEEVIPRQIRLSTTTTPVPRTKVNNKECGLSQGIDWFQEHAMGDTDELEATWPWMVAIRFQKKSSGHSEPGCSGFLIDKIHVLSAAHCFDYRKNVTIYTARIGSDDQDLAEEYPISEIKPHEDYKPGFYHYDIAILTLAREVNIPNFVPICLPGDRIAAKDLTGLGTTIVGWGSEKTYGPVGNILKQLDGVPIVSNEECSNIFTRLMQNFKRHFPRGITGDILCAGQTELARDACTGFSGGPVMLLYKKHWFAVGLSSFGFRCGIPGVPGGYTRISSYVDWIKQNTENSSLPMIPNL